MSLADLDERNSLPALVRNKVGTLNFPLLSVIILMQSFVFGNNVWPRVKTFFYLEDQN